MKVSVIIPVFNLEQFVGRAIDSALSQDEVFECLVIDDGSTDNTKRVCERVARKDSRVKVLNHPKNENRGTSASRNLGLKTAQGDFIAFLDADDYYLPNRFKPAHRAFQLNPLIDGVYDAMVSDTELLKENPEMTTMTKELKPDELFDQMAPFGNDGHFSICALTVKREAARETGFFDETIAIVEDTLWLSMLAASKILVPGNIIKPVVVRGLHDENSSKNLMVKRGQKVRMMKKLQQWMAQNEQVESRRIKVFEVLLKYHHEHNHLFSDSGFLPRKVADLRLLMFLSTVDPILKKNERFKYFARLVLHRVRGKHMNYYE